MSMRSAIVSALGAFLVGAASSAAHAAVESDAGVIISAGQLVTVAVSEAGDPLGPARVFASDFGTLAGFVFTDEPGNQVAPGTLTGATRYTISIRAALRRWNGSDFSQIAHERFNAQDDGGTFSVFSPPTDPGALAPLPAYDLPVRPDGGLHAHTSNYLFAADLVSPGSTGIYLLELQQSTDLPGVAPSLPYYIVYNFGESEAAHQAALDFAENVLVPVPGAGVLLLGLGLVSTRRRR